MNHYKTINDLNKAIDQAESEYTEVRLAIKRAKLYRKLKEDLHIDCGIDSDDPILMVFSRYPTRKSKDCYK